MKSVGNVLFCCTSVEGGIQATVFPAGSILAAGVCSFRGLELPRRGRAVR